MLAMVCFTTQVSEALVPSDLGCLKPELRQRQEPRCVTSLFGGGPPKKVVFLLVFLQNHKKGAPLTDEPRTVLCTVQAVPCSFSPRSLLFRQWAEPLGRCVISKQNGGFLKTNRSPWNDNGVLLVALAIPTKGSRNLKLRVVQLARPPMSSSNEQQTSHIVPCSYCVLR